MTTKNRDFTFTWGQHAPQFLSVLSSFLETEKLVDVTLATSEGKLIHVHRLVLLASSPYFEEMLQMHPKKGAVIFLKDVPFSVLVALVEFMYGGSVTIGEEQLVSFIHTANILKIKGLAVGDGNWMGHQSDEHQQKEDLLTTTDSVGESESVAATGGAVSGCCYCCCSCSTSSITPSPSPSPIDTKQEIVTQGNAILPFHDDRQLTVAEENNKNMQQQENQPTTQTNLDEIIVLANDNEEAPAPQNVSSVDDLRQLQITSSAETQQQQQEEKGVVPMDEAEVQTNEANEDGQKLDVQQQQQPKLTTSTTTFADATLNIGLEGAESSVSTTSVEDTGRETNLVASAETATDSYFGSSISSSSTTETKTVPADNIQHHELPPAQEKRPADTVTELINFIASVVSPVEQSLIESEKTDKFQSNGSPVLPVPSALQTTTTESLTNVTSGDSTRKRSKSNKKTKSDGEKKQSASDTSCNSIKSRKRTREQVAVEEEEEEGCVPEGNDKTEATLTAAAEAALKPFVCPNSECGRRYKYDNGLKSHLRECGVEPQFQCPLCTSRFKRSDHLKRHKLRVHQEASTSAGATATAIATATGSKGKGKGKGTAGLIHHDVALVLGNQGEHFTHEEMVHSTPDDEEEDSSVADSQHRRDKTDDEDHADCYAPNKNEEKVLHENIALADQVDVKRRQIRNILCRRLAAPRSGGTTDVDGALHSPDPQTLSTDESTTAVTMEMPCDYEYLVLWKSSVGEEDNCSTWEPYDSLANFKPYRTKLDMFHRVAYAESRSSNDSTDATTGASSPKAKRRSCSSNRVAKRNTKLN